LADSYLHATSQSADGRRRWRLGSYLSTHSFLIGIFFSHLQWSTWVHSTIPVDLSFCARSVVAWSTYPANYGRPLSCSSVYLSYYNASIPRWFTRLSAQATMNRTS